MGNPLVPFSNTSDWPEWPNRHLWLFLETKNIELRWPKIANLYKIALHIQYDIVGKAAKPSPISLFIEIRHVTLFHELAGYGVIEQLSPKYSMCQADIRPSVMRPTPEPSHLHCCTRLMSLVKSHIPGVT